MIVKDSTICHSSSFFFFLFFKLISRPRILLDNPYMEMDSSKTFRAMDFQLLLTWWLCSLLGFSPVSLLTSILLVVPSPADWYSYRFCLSWCKFSSTPDSTGTPGSSSFSHRCHRNNKLVVWVYHTPPLVFCVSSLNKEWEWGVGTRNNSVLT